MPAAHDQYDRSSKWLIQHHGNALLWLGGVRDVVSWRPLQAEIVQPRQLPDGLLEVHIAGHSDPVVFVLELATYPEERLLEQVVRDMALVYLERRSLPEVLTLVLRPKGNLRVTGVHDLRSLLGLTGWQARWRVVELWTLPAAQLLAANDVGLIPCVPLTEFTGPPEPVLQQCRERIDQQAAADERANLLAVTQVMTRLRYNDPWLLRILGGSQAMIESPLIQEIVAKNVTERGQKDILRVLKARFGSVSEDVTAALETISDEQALDQLVELAARCRTLSAFRKQLRR